MNNIKIFREREKLTQDALATKLNIARTTVTMWETGESKPKTEMLPRLAKELNCTIDDLFENEKEGG